MVNEKTAYISRGSCVYEVLDKLYTLEGLPKPYYLGECNCCNGFKECNISLEKLIQAALLRRPNERRHPED